MSLPVDDMLADLRAALESFSASPGHETFAAVQHEMMRIERECENALPDDE